MQLSVTDGSITANSFAVTWLDFSFFAQNSLDRYQLVTTTHSRTVNTIVGQEPFQFFERGGTISELSAGTVYNVSMRALFFNGIVGLNSSILVATQETGEPWNV